MVGGLKKHVSLGLYKIESEAAIAHNAAAVLLRGEEFAYLNSIDARDMPSEERFREIRSYAIANVKATLEGRKLGKNASSQMRGVSWRRTERAWLATIGYTAKLADGRTRKDRVQLGSFPSEAEAAYAYNVALLALGRKTTPNTVAACDVPNWKAIRDVVETRIANRDRERKRYTRRSPSGWLCISFDRRKNCWKARRSRSETHVHLGCHQSEAEAALAVNIAANLDGFAAPNAIPADRMPETDRVKEIDANVKDRLAVKARGLGQYYAIGERHAQAKLTNCQVEEIRNRRKRGENNNALAAEIGVSSATISRWFTGKRRSKS